MTAAFNAQMRHQQKHAVNGQILTAPTWKSKVYMAATLCYIGYMLDTARYKMIIDRQPVDPYADIIPVHACRLHFRQVVRTTATKHGISIGNPPPAPARWQRAPPEWTCVGSSAPNGCEDPVGLVPRISPTV